jgi:pimeloyl-ACP methyl ester carboxylesterase
MATIVLAHGAWSAAWAWRKMRPLFRAAGHDFFAPTYTGLGERAHLAQPEIDLSLHIRDVHAALEAEDLRDVTLIGHSYGGMVATGVADRAADRLARLIYLDAFVPLNGQSLFDLAGPEMETSRRAMAAAEGDGWRIPPNPPPADTSPEDVAWAAPRRRWQPIRTFEERISLAGPPLPQRHYIYATRAGPGDVFRQFAQRARSEPGWHYHEIDASHNPHVTCPDVLNDLLAKIVG